MAASLRMNADENKLPIADGDMKKTTMVGVAAKRPIARRNPLWAISNRIPQANKPEEKDLKPVSRISNLKPQIKVAVKPTTTSILAPNKLKLAQEKTVVVPPEPVVDVVPELPKLPAIRDVDEDDYGNPQLVSAYVKDIYEYLRSLEVQFPVSEDFLKDRNVTGRMRSIMLDWLLQVCMKFGLLAETFYLTIDIFDRYVQLPDQLVHKGNLQLIGISALFIATKYEEMYSPPIDDYVYITDKSCTGKEIRLMEIKILKSLNFFLGKPTPLHFLRRNSKVGEVDVMVHTLAKYLIELSIMEYSMAHVKPSILSAAALCMSLQLLKKDKWNDILQHYSTYSEAELTPVMNAIAKTIVKSETSKLQTARNKYGSSRFLKISLIPELKSAKISQMAAKAS